MTVQILRIAKALATNQLAKVAPSLYVKLTKQTGRGNEETDSPSAIAKYFKQCVADYFEVLGIPADQQRDFILDKTVLEYGPGDIPGVALLFVALGARKIYCVDRFPLVAIGEKNSLVIKALADSLDDIQRTRLISCLKGFGSAHCTLDSSRIEYLVRPNGLSGMREEVDLVISRAVLEHVNNLHETFRDMSQALRSGSLAIHQVDLKSHGLHRSNPLDFLEDKSWLWNIMYSNKGFPNRWRINHYREILSKMPLEILKLEPISHFNDHDVAAVIPNLSWPFSGISKEDLSWQGFWLICSKKP